MRISDWSSDVCSSDLSRMTISVLTVDDEPLALRRLELILAKLPEVEHVGSASGCREAVAKIAELQPDIVLLAIKMRDGTGFDVLSRLPEDGVLGVIFTQAFAHFAFRPFEAPARSEERRGGKG